MLLKPFGSDPRNRDENSVAEAGGDIDVLQVYKKLIVALIFSIQENSIFWNKIDYFGTYTVFTKLGLVTIVGSTT